MAIVTTRAARANALARYHSCGRVDVGRDELQPDKLERNGERWIAASLDNRHLRHRWDDSTAS